MAEQKSLREYWNMLASHDWFYEYSDDHSVWRRGNAAESTLRLHAAQSPEHRALYDEFREHHFGRMYGREQKPLPPRPAA